ncbi:hypothetical protein ACH5RR_005884 [Cinchona calisaya]|uniref:C3H1-type domain-containing protein n=1 Tax=Cinchona calisaya TaxID=153742 RepID=A0ABD3AMF5_9GENT
MSFPNPPPPPPPPSFMPMPSVDGDVGGFWPGHPLDRPGFPVNHENFDTYPHFDHAHPLKRPQNSENNSTSSAPMALPINPRMNPLILPGSKGTSHIFYKTRMCVKFLEGNCKNGESCTFAHGIEDKREPPPNWQELVREKDGGARNWVDDQRLIHTMKLCKKFYSGEECPYGERCNFLHERPIPSFSSFEERPKSRTDMPMQRESSVISIGTRGYAIGNVRGFDQSEISKPVNPNMDALRAKQVFWKTKLCSKWEITGHCPYGERCQFAHGQSELIVSTAQVDVEVTVNSSPIQTQAAALPVTDSYPANVEVGTPLNEAREGKNFSRWILKRKINKIYADWIDDLSPPHAFLNEVADP